MLKRLWTKIKQKLCVHQFYWMRNLLGEEARVKKRMSEVWCPWCGKWELSDFFFQMDGKDYRP
jgi:hypothetical protein